MSTKHITKTIKDLKQRVYLLEILHHNTQKHAITHKKTAGDALRDVAGLWKRKPRTGQDLQKARKRLFGE